MLIAKQGSTRVKQQVITVTARHPTAPERVVDPERVKEIARTITQKLHRIQKNIVELKQVFVLAIVCVSCRFAGKDWKNPQSLLFLLSFLS